MGPDRFLEALHSGRVLLMDGAMGTELQRAGLAEGACGELWNLTHPDRVRRIHQAYADAGAECLLTNTFQANPQALAKHGLADQFREIFRAGVELARSVAGRDRFVHADVGPFGTVDAASWIAEVIMEIGNQIDGILVETIGDPSSLQGAKTIVQALASVAEALPLLLSLTFQRLPDGSLCTVSGVSPEDFARDALRLQPVALGVNCGRELAMTDIARIVRAYRNITSLPLFARPNAGTPVRIGGARHYPLTPAQMADDLRMLLEAGACMVGGCCGTTPEHITFCAARRDGFSYRRHLRP